LILLKKISTPEELSGLLNYALDGLDRILKQKDFSYSKINWRSKRFMDKEIR